MHFAPGEGYVLDDSAWVHARGYLSLEVASEQRRLRMSYDNRVTTAARDRT